MKRYVSQYPSMTAASTTTSVGARLRRECGSIVDAAGGPRVTTFDVMSTLEKFPGIAERLRSKVRVDRPFTDRFDFLIKFKDTPQWTEALRQALTDKREEMMDQALRA
jgi:hypothetical protein